MINYFIAKNNRGNFSPDDQFLVIFLFFDLRDLLVVFILIFKLIR